MNCLETLLHQYNHTPPDHLYHQVLGHLLAHLREASCQNIYELSELCFTSPSTLSRMVRHLGFRSFGSFQQALNDALQQYFYHNRMLPWNVMVEKEDAVPSLVDAVEGQLHFFRHNYDRRQYQIAASLLHQSRKVLIIAGNSVLESVLQMDLIFSGKPCVLFPENATPEDFDDVDENCCILFHYTNRINAQATDRLFRHVSKFGAKMIVITNTTNLRIFENASCVLYFDGKMHLVDLFGYQLILASLAMHYRTAYIDRTDAQNLLP